MLETLRMLAEQQYGSDITPCGDKTWRECLTYEECIDTYIFWFNTPDGSTHVVKSL